MLPNIEVIKDMPLIELSEYVTEEGELAILTTATAENLGYITSELSNITLGRSNTKISVSLIAPLDEDFYGD